MEFINARNGIKKVYAAAMINLIASIVLGVLGIFGTTGTALAILFVVVAVLVLIAEIVAYIINLVGLGTAAKDHSYLRIAFVISIISLVIGVINGIFSVIPTLSVAVFSSVLEIINGIINVLVVIFVCLGCSKLLEQKGNSGLAAKGTRTAWAYAIIYIVAVVLGAITVVNIVAGIILSIATLVFGVIAFVWYISFLARAKEAL